MAIFRSPSAVRQPPLPLLQPPHDPSANSQHNDTSFSSATSTASSRRNASLLPNASVPSTPSQAPALYPALPSVTPNSSQQRNGLRLPCPPPPADKFPSLDEMAQAQKQKDTLSGRANSSFSSSSNASASKAYTFSSSSSRAVNPSSSATTLQVPSSLPRLHKPRHSNGDRPVTRRSSLTAMEAARQRAGSETPTAVANARTQRQQPHQQAGFARALDSSFGGDVDDDSHNASGALVAGPNGAIGANMSIDVESGKMPTLRRLSTAKHNNSNNITTSNMGAAAATMNAAGLPSDQADLSTASQRSRRNGEDRPISSGYDFSKYLEHDIDPFNANTRKEARRESRPLPVPAAEGEDEASRSYDSSGGDETLRGGAILPPPKQSARSLTTLTGPDSGNEQRQGQEVGSADSADDQQATPKGRPSTAPSNDTDAALAGRAMPGSMPPPSQLPRPQFKVRTLTNSQQPATMMMLPPPMPMPMQSTPRATPQAGSRKIGHLSGFNVPGVPSVAASTTVAHGTAAAAAGHAGDESSSVTASAKKRRLNPAARTNRLVSLELAEAKNKAKLLAEKLEISEDQKRRALEDSEGWASESTRLEEDVARLRSQLDSAAAQLHRTTSELDARAVQHKLESDERQWRLLCQKRSFCELESDLVYCKNEMTYESYRGKEVEADLLMEKDGLRIRLMAERKRSDLLVSRLKVKLREALLLRKRLKARSGGDASLRGENERLRFEVEEMQADLEAAHAEASGLRKQLAASAKASKRSDEIEKLQQENDEMKEDIATYAEREEMMAETRKVWKKERKEMQAQIRELEAQLLEQQASKPASKRRTAAANQDMNAADALSDDSLAAPPMVAAPAAAARKKGLLAKARRDPMQGASDAVPSEADLPPLSNGPSHKAAKKTKTAPSASALARSALAAASKQKGKKSRYQDDDLDDDEQSDAASEQYNDDQDEDKYAAPAAIVSKKGGAAKKGAKAKAGGATSTAAAAMAKGSKKVKAPVAIEHDEYTADPSATPMIRSKRSMEEMMAEGEEEDGEAATGEVEDSFRGRASTASRVARDRTNVAATTTTTTTTASDAVTSQPLKKKKRKLLGGGGGGGAGGAGLMNWGSHGDENAGLQPDYNIPLELSPIKPAAGGGRLGGMFAGLGSGRGPFG